MMQIEPRPDNEYRTQEQWIPFFNKLGQPMISAPNTLQLAKENNIVGMETVRKDFDRWLTTSSQLQYNPNDLSATIIHNAGSTVVTPKEIKLKCVPVYRGTALKEVLKTTDGLAFIKTIFDTDMDANQIMQHLETLSKRDKDKMRVWTPSQGNRKDRPIRSVDLYFGVFGRFLVDGSGWFDYDGGYSHGVVMDSEPKARTKFKSKQFSQEEIKSNCETEPQKAVAMMMYNDRYHKKRK